MLKKLVVIIFIFLEMACGPDEKSIEYYNSQISSIVDSTIYYKPVNTKKYFFLVEDKWYVIPATFYGFFINYIKKGDSLYKDAGRWDIYVYKKKNGEWVEKYFRGAQDSWK